MFKMKNVGISVIGLPIYKLRTTFIEQHFIKYINSAGVNIHKYTPIEYLAL